MKRTLFGMLGVALLCTCVALPLWADEPPAQPGQPRELPESSKPGPEHRKLAKLAGTWSVSGRCLMSPDATEMGNLQGTAKFEVILDGRFLKQHFQGQMQDQKFEGIEISGFCRESNKYTSYWVDSISTSPMFMTGESSDAGKTIVLTGEHVDPMTKIKGKVRSVMTWSNDNELKFETYMHKDGKEQKVLELTYKRQGADRPAR